MFPEAHILTENTRLTNAKRMRIRATDLRIKITFVKHLKPSEVVYSLRIKLTCHGIIVTSTACAIYISAISDFTVYRPQVEGEFSAFTI